MRAISRGNKLLSLEAMFLFKSTAQCLKGIDREQTICLQKLLTPHLNMEAKSEAVSIP